MNETPGPGGWGEKLVRNWEGVFPEMSRSGMRTGTCWVCFWEKDVWRRGESEDDILKRAISGWCRVAGLSKPDLKRRLTRRFRKLLKIFVLHKCN